MIIDFHAHIVPGSDHGCRNIEMSKSQLELAKQAGVDAIVSVSHFYPTRESRFELFERVEPARAELRALSESDSTLPKMFFGTEVTLCKGLEKIPDIENLCIEGTKTILIEMPFSKWDKKLFQSLEAIKYDLGLNPVLAHVDRYKPEEVEKLFALEIPGQVNFYSLNRFFKKKRLLKWIGEGFIHALGSDIHGLEPGYTGFNKALKTIGKENLEYISAKSKELLNL